jgi:hypothetical protein
MKEQLEAIGGIILLFVVLGVGFTLATIAVGAMWMAIGMAIILLIHYWWIPVIALCLYLYSVHRSAS